MISVVFNITTAAMCLLVFLGSGLVVYTVFRLAKEVFKCESPMCKWSANVDKYGQSYKTECGKAFFDATESGEPVTDWVKYCPYCSSEVKVKEGRGL